MPGNGRNVNGAAVSVKSIVSCSAASAENGASTRADMRADAEARKNPPRAIRVTLAANRNRYGHYLAGVLHVDHPRATHREMDLRCERVRIRRLVERKPPGSVTHRAHLHRRLDLRALRRRVAERNVDRRFLRRISGVETDDWFSGAAIQSGNIGDDVSD